ncbi:sensor histidine kinase KdpD [Bacillus sp. FJAT-29814]|uniref:sensor histidine kinase n=1 Tax=Bacillus sp. FJAT-29814 TaxID=1729688 RepID=UPI000835C15C|nr:HAMP domain-containing sensor histidine kinase [Bacillus sp. FJAT-29814]
MATRWKSSIVLYIWAFFLTFALGGIMTFFTSGQRYIHQDYFHTPEFQSELDQIASYLAMFELNKTTPEEAKAAITVSAEEIDEHRYRYGDLDSQISNIKEQYESRIQDALASNNEEVANVYIKERDTKIDDISKNFSSDDHVRQKILKEKEAKIDKFFKERNQYLADFSRYSKTFTYYYKDPNTGEVHTNLADSNQGSLKQSDMLYVTDFSIPSNYFIHFGSGGYDEISEALTAANNNVSFEGQLGIAKNLEDSNFIMREYNNYKQNQSIMLVYVLASGVVLLLCLFFSRRMAGVNADLGNWRPYYNKLPIDIRVALFAVVAIIGVITTAVMSDSISYLPLNPYLSNVVEIVFNLAIAALLVMVAYIQLKFLMTDLKDWPNLKIQWEKSLMKKSWKLTKQFFISAKENLVEAFLVQSIGVQVFVLLAAVFFIGMASFMTAINPIFILFYLVLLAAAGVPLGIFLLKKVGYFNRIVKKTNELAEGKLGEDLPVKGKSVFATLAGNINVLKQGVKQSQSEQAKSERLKTELITNVSHDLRTPLTSIITYTQLLKESGLSEDERKAYLEIIDRKSKRLKILIDDLFEVSKMATGNIKLVKERVDLNQLLEQALAEYDETIQASSLQFRVTKASEPVYALVDGQKLWRVFDNLIGNILKYSLENSRVYISIVTHENQAVLTFKNVSKYELSDNADELYERFKRGDTSRHTDGSGLGLAIVKSIIDLHEGKMDIEADGDLFKVMITLWMES